MLRVYILLLFIFVLPGCGIIKEASVNLIDEELLARTVSDELDKKKDSFIEKVRSEVEIAGKAINSDLNTQVVQKLMDRVDTTVNRSLATLTNKVDQSARELSKRHKELLGRLPWYGLYLIFLLWTASLIDDVFRWLVGKQKRRGK